jgi:DNA (cytosine-5)-methyltransferase 1
MPRILSSKIGACPRVVDLFAGAGLFSLAFAMERFDVVRAIESNPIAAATYRLNLGDHIEVRDVRDVVPDGRADVLIAGPPCQGFSTLGKRDSSDPRNRLSLSVVEWARVLDPVVVVIENVPAFLESFTCKVVQRKLSRLGYEIRTYVVNASDFGVPQLRNRCFVIASKRSLPERIIPIRAANACQTVREAWAGLPPEPDHENNHYSPTPSGIALERMKVVPPGGDKRDIVRRAPHLAARSWIHLIGAATDVWGRMLWDAPSNTLRTALQNASKGRYIHPEQNRVISLREAARLHSIDDSWQFHGLPTQIARQIGNSVPPLLGRAVARTVRSVFA